MTPDTFEARGESATTAWTPPLGFPAVVGLLLPCTWRDRRTSGETTESRFREHNT